LISRATRPESFSDSEAVASFRLSAAQLVIARRYDFDSWTGLKRHVELIEHYSRLGASVRRVTDTPGAWVMARPEQHLTGGKS
jgi:hypothetical protein